MAAPINAYRHRKAVPLPSASHETTCNIARDFALRPADMSSVRLSRMHGFLKSRLYNNRFFARISSQTTKESTRDLNFIFKFKAGHRILKGVIAAAVGFIGYIEYRSYGQNTGTVATCEEKSQMAVLINSNDNNNCLHRRSNIEEAICDSRDIVQRIKDEVGTPGLVISVSVDGKTVWSEGFGYADVENRVPCKPETVMRIASISKPISMVVAARLWEAGQLDLDKPVSEYVSAWPEKYFHGDKVTITTRQLVSHLGGIRHYDKSCKKKSTSSTSHKNKTDNESAKEAGSEKGESSTTKEKKKNKKAKSEFDLDEYLIRRHYNSVTDALELFKEDNLCSKPGTEFLYSSHGWSLISAALEGASGYSFPVLLKGLLKDLGMQQTYLDENDLLIYNRARFYVKNDRGRLTNAPYVDCSYKWAGGGLLSTVIDLNKFGNSILYSYQKESNNSNSSPMAAAEVHELKGSPNNADIQDQNSELPGYLQSGTVKAMWSPVEKTKCGWDADGQYGMGWGVVPPAVRHGAARKQRFYVSHTGGAIGASSVLLILPREVDCFISNRPPQGVVVSIIVNLQSVSLNRTALEVAKRFEEVEL